MKPETAFIPSDKHKGFVHLYVNGKKTNMWYNTPDYKYYNTTCDDDRKKLECEIVKNLIDTGKIVAPDWDMWDTCAHEEYFIKELTVVDKIDFQNKVMSLSGYEDYTNKERQKTIIKELIGSRQFVQTLRRIIGNELSDKMGIAFNHYGYSIGFIK